jgi:signal transduction histidine kinase
VYIFTLSSSALAIASICLSVLLAIALIERLLSSTHKDKINEELELSLSACNTSTWRYDIKNDIFRKVHGSPVCGNEVSKEEFIQSIHPQDIFAFNKEFNNLLNRKSISTNITVRCINKTMTSGYGFYLFDMIAKSTENGSLEYIIGIERDITFDKLSDTNYQNVLTSLNLSIKASNLIFWYYDVEGDMLYKLVNKEFVPTSNLHEFLSQSLPSNDRSEILRIYQDLIDNRLGDFHGNLALMNPEGNDYLTYECYAMPTKDSTGKVIKVVGTLQDITVKHAEHIIAAENNKRFMLAMKTSNFVLWEYDCHTQLFTAFNEPLNNYNNDVKLSIIDYLHVLHPDDINKLVPINEHLSLRHDIDFSIDLRFKDTEDGDWQYYTLTGAPFERDDFGRVIKFAGIRKNNTNFMKLNNELKLAKEKAERSDKLKTLFLANMTHEIRTPLNAIVGFSQLLQSATSKEELDHFCTIISHNNEMLLTIFNDIIDLSRVEAGFIDFTCINFDMSSQIESLREIFKHKIPEGVEFIIDNPYSYFEVCLDWNRLVQIYTNFINNACKYTSKGSITIGYKADDKGIKIFCKDTGIGIAEEDQKRIFNSFEKVDSYIQGLGLGLSLCNAIAKAAGGSIGVESEHGAGSLFWAVMPCEPKYQLKKEMDTISVCEDRR